MRKCLTIKDHKSLEIELRELKQIISTQETEIKSTAQAYVLKLPEKIFFSQPKKDPITNLPMVQNPTGKLLAKAVNKTVLRKQGFITKFIAGVLSKQVGKVIEKKVLKG